MKIKNFSEYLSESDDFSKEEKNTFMKKKDKKNEGEKSKTEEDLEKWDKENSGTCPRCGNTEKECSCQEKDYYSTVNAYRIPTGHKVTIKK